MVLKLSYREMNITVVTQYIPGGMKQMKKNYGKFGKLDYYLPNLILFGSSTVVSTTCKLPTLEYTTLSPHDFRQMEGIFG